MIGRKLERARQSMGYSISDIERRTRIDRKHLIAIEKGFLEELPSPIYIRSYIGSYARVVGINPQALLSSLRNQTYSEANASLVQVSRFVSENVDDENNDLMKEISSVNVVAATLDHSPRVSLPRDLPKPDELGICQAVEHVESNYTTRSRSISNKKRKKSYDRMYTWILISSGILLVVLVLFSLLYMKVRGEEITILKTLVFDMI